ncbi:11032_t:CDS:2 [Acaulospora colombiana]|uniref:11032_t:CDS:1 n=1 Tax=Acaulospora colombiana TaxID=27376 RepID=A0ACA9M0X4_9GLOM|nr:11032_t:CDS:2 [Acaulospora colombiana]
MSSSHVILISGGNGFIGSHVAKYLHENDHKVIIADIHNDPTFRLVENVDEFCTEFCKVDIRNVAECRELVKRVAPKWIFHFAANMGGMGTIHPSNNFIIYKDNHIMTLNLLQVALETGVERFFYSSSACVYPCRKQRDVNNTNFKLKESDVWNLSETVGPDPQDLYGAEKLNSEIVLKSIPPNSIKIRIARFHNVYGEGGCWYGGREKAPAALLRKAICANKYIGDNTIEIWGTGEQRRSFLYIDDCVDAVIKLMESDCNEVVNIGSEESVSIEELAYIAFETLGVPKEEVTLRRVEDKPVGVRNRNSDDTFIKERLGWSPTHNINDGMKKTSDWIKHQIYKRSTQYRNNPSAWKSMVESYLSSEIKYLARDNEFTDTITFGILLPITSRGLPRPEDCLDNLARFSESLYDTSVQDLLERNYRIKIYLGIDKDDKLFHSQEDNPALNILCKNQDNLWTVDTTEFTYPPGSICAIWRDLAKKACKECDYTVLLGDDVIIETRGWMKKIHDAFVVISNEKKVPRGFGCVSFFDTSFPGFPAFPVIGRLHFEIFGEIFPMKFHNQDGDPFLFQIYRRWGCSVMLQDVKLRNTIGGSQLTRYEKKYCQGWGFEILDEAVKKVDSWLNNNCPDSPSMLLTLDIIIPSYRVDLNYLGPIINLERPSTISTMVIIIIDNPDSQYSDILKKFYEKDPFIRIRENETNLGASETRNRGLRESSADYVLFLDDDVTPDPDILFECEKVIREHPNACGFIGNSKFPDASHEIYTCAIVMSGVTYFWDAAEKFEEDLPWGVTANLLVRRYNDGILFDPIFPKTGGGEDIDFCLRKREFFVNQYPGGEGFRCAPKVRVVHPWWNHGKRSYWRFYGWAKGDGALIKLYPKLTFRDAAPNSAELLGAMILLFACTISISAVYYDTTLSFSLPLLILISIPTIIAANVVVDIHLHMYENPDECVPNVRGYRRILASIESSLIRMVSEGGRLMGLIERGELRSIGRRFDWFVRRSGDGPMLNERRNTRKRFLTWMTLVILEATIFGYIIDLEYPFFFFPQNL